jgi:hypothetical protein
MKTCKDKIFAVTNATKILFLMGEPSKGLRIGFLWLLISLTLFSLEGWAGKGESLFDHSAPIHTGLTASIFFEYQTYKNYPGPGGWTDFPLSPNRWKIQMHMTNEDSGVFEIIPIFLFNERYKKDTQWIENSMAIGPLHYQARFRREVPFPVRGVPAHAPGVVSEKIDLQMTQHDFPPSKEAAAGGFYDVLNMRASLQKAGESQHWRRQAFSPRNTLDIEWDAWSSWAFPEHVRQTKHHFVSTLGPVMIKAGKNTTHAVIPVLEFVADNLKNFHRLNGRNVQFIELSITGIHSIERSSPEIHAFLQALLKEFPEK